MKCKHELCRILGTIAYKCICCGRRFEKLPKGYKPVVESLTDADLAYMESL